MNTNPNNLPEVQTIQFHEDTVTTLRVGEEVRVAIKPIADRMGLDWVTQLKNIKRAPVLNQVMGIIPTTSTGKDGKVYTVEMVTLPLEYLNGWLLKVNAGRYKPDDPRREYHAVSAGMLPGALRLLA